MTTVTTLSLKVYVMKLIRFIKPSMSINHLIVMFVATLLSKSVCYINFIMLYNPQNKTKQSHSYIMFFN